VRARLGSAWRAISRSRLGGTVFGGRQRAQQRRDAAQIAVDANLDDPIAWHDLADALAALGDTARADRGYIRAVALAPDSASMWKRGNSGRAGLAGIDEACDPAFVTARRLHNLSDADAWTIHAGALALRFRLADAAAAADAALALDPRHVAARRIGVHARLHACDWTRRPDDESAVSEGVRDGVRIVTPFDHRCLSDSEPESLRLGRLTSRSWPPPVRPLWSGKRYQHQRIRVAYVSTDLRAHAVGSLMVSCFERHDRTAFEITSVSLRHGDGSALEQRIRAASDRFIDAHANTDLEIASLLSRLEIDIVVDLNGHSGARRPGIFALRPAPVQATYLGYPGTTGAPFIDYLIADPTVVPDAARAFYSEQVVHLPHCYLPVDSARSIADRTPTRVEAGLPDRGFVFACFNNSSKIAPPVFDVWSRLLRDVPDSVLWLRSGDDEVMANLRGEASRRGVAHQRIVFAPRLASTEEHLARLRLADLFLDTLPYNAHTTAIDALWAGLPVLTCLGRSFAGRVGASILRAAGLPELIAESLDDYERLARDLAQDPPRLVGARRRLAASRATAPLFDADGFTRDLEHIYRTVMSRLEQR
jgi:protein O-GlcNAc transferase